MLVLTSASEAPVLLFVVLRAAGVERTKADGGCPYLTTDPFAGPNRTCHIGSIRHSEKGSSKVNPSAKPNADTSRIRDCFNSSIGSWV